MIPLSQVRLSPKKLGYMGLTQKNENSALLGHFGVIKTPLGGPNQKSAQKCITW